MQTKNQTIYNSLQAQPVNLTKNGACSRCGSCCASILPLSEGDIARLKKFIADTGFEPIIQDGENVIQAQCPFLVKPDTDSDKHACAAYDHRPDVCRTFICSNSNAENASAWYSAYHKSDMPGPKNAWQLFNKTGIRFAGQDIPYNKAPFCRIQEASGQCYEFHVGRPASFMLDGQEFVPPSIIINITQEGLEVFHASKHGLVFIKYTQICEVLSEECFVENLDEDPS